MEQENELREPWVFLLGRPPMDEYLSFRVQAAGVGGVDVAAAAALWSAAADVTEAVMVEEAGAADNAPIVPLPAAMEAEAAAFLADPSVAASYLTVPPRIALVDLRTLVVFQRQINLRYTSELENSIPGVENDVGLLRFCLAIDQPQPTINAFQAAGNVFVFSSKSTDARLLEARLVSSEHIESHAVAGRPQSAVVIHVGFGVNALNVISINGRLILNNGSHRAYALRVAGRTVVPAVIQTLTRADELAIAPAVQQATELYMTHPRPPMLKDYFDPRLRDVVYSPARTRQIRIQVGAEQLDGPG